MDEEEELEEQEEEQEREAEAEVEEEGEEEEIEKRRRLVRNLARECSKTKEEVFSVLYSFSGVLDAARDYLVYNSGAYEAKRALFESCSSSSFILL